MFITYSAWDLEISRQLKDKFDFIDKFVQTLTTVKVSRCYIYNIMPHDYIVSCELHGFSDASEKVYRYCPYLKCVTKNNFIPTLLFASNLRVAPYKTNCLVI